MVAFFCFFLCSSSFYLSRHFRVVLIDIAVIMITMFVSLVSVLSSLTTRALLLQYVSVGFDWFPVGFDGFRLDFNGFRWASMSLVGFDIFGEYNIANSRLF